MYKNLKQILSLFSKASNKPYFISLEQENLAFTKEKFRIDFYAICICVEGEMTIEIDHQEYCLVANSFFILGPSTRIHYKKSNKKFKMKLLFFEKNFLLKNLSNPFIIEKTVNFQKNNYSIIECRYATIKNLCNIMDYLKEKTQEEGLFTDEIIRTIIINLILEIAEITHKNYSTIADVPNSVSDVYLAFRKLISENILENKSVQFYADQLNISSKYLLEIVKNASEKTPHQIIDEVLLNEAYVLLGDTSLSISEIAYKLQFNSTSAFGRFFKKQVAISPSKYRKREHLIH